MTLDPRELATLCRRTGLAGLAWLDSATGEPGSRSVLAACPRRIVAGAPPDWARFEEDIHAFQRQYPGGSIIGSVDYGGGFCFGFYPQPLVYEHGQRQWRMPGGAPDWLTAIEAQAPAAPVAPAWDRELDFAMEMDARRFAGLVCDAQAYIAAGDIYQVNLAHRLHAPWPRGADPFALYCKLREHSPAPQAAYLSLGEARTVLCASPEEFLRFDGRRVRTRPIKGTRPRGATPDTDARIARDLCASPKERAELLMITDLMRNDLGQVCEYGSVSTPELFRLERFAQVHHLVATVEGRLREDVSHAAALRACLPGGSITGAPKIRAREIIGQLEPAPRGLYTGSIGCFGLGDAGQSRFNIVIRTLVIDGDEAHFHVGAGIVADSDPHAEWRETLDKAAGILRAASTL